MYFSVFTLIQADKDVHSKYYEDISIKLKLELVLVQVQFPITARYFLHTDLKSPI